MRRLTLTGSVIIAGACLALGGHASATTVQSLGMGSAVTSMDRSATFDSLTANGIPLSDYTEDGLYVRVDGDSWVGDGVTAFDPFRGASGHDPALYFPESGSPDWVTIETTDSKKIFGVEFLYGNGWTTGDIYGVPWGNENAWVVWQTWNGGTMVSTGQIGPEPILPLGTTLGFFDPDGFDQLLVKCIITNSVPSDYQALAMDNLMVQLTVPEPSSLVCLAGALGLLGTMRRRIRI